ncbi:MAG: hypothetical protein H6835_02815 [Planctomycetes bacterium]|nr:hypothetical protein [Planctomycetota bacterium]
MTEPRFVSPAVQEWRWHVPTALLLTVVIYLPYLLGRALCLVGLGWRLQAFELYLLVPGIALLLVLPGAVGMLFRRTRRAAAPTLCCALMLLLGFVVVDLVGDRLRRLGFENAAERARPLVAALQRYVEERGAPPEQVGDLVPKALDRMPEKLPELKVLIGDEAMHTYGTRWALEADVSTGSFNWDRWVWLPKGAAPMSRDDRTSQRTGDWWWVRE